MSSFEPIGPRPVLVGPRWITLVKLDQILGHDPQRSVGIDAVKIDPACHQGSYLYCMILP